MKKILLLTILPLIGCPASPDNCILTQNMCGTGEMCDPVLQKCVTVTPVTPTTQLSLLTVKPFVSNLNQETTVTITGTGFQGPMMVQVGAGWATSVIVKSATELTAAFPQSSERCGAVPVRIINADTTTASKSGAFYYKVPQLPSFRTPTSPALQGTTGISELLVDNVTTEGRNDIIVKNASTVSLCMYDTSGLTCNAPINYTLSGPTFMRTHDLDRNTKTDLLIIPRTINTTANKSGILISNLATNDASQTPITYDFKSQVSINDMVAVDRLIGNTTELWTATSTGIVALTVGPRSVLDSKPLSSEVLQSLILARTESLTAGPELIGVASGNGARVLDRDLMQSTFMLKSMSFGSFTKLRLGDVSGDGIADLVGIALNGNEPGLYVALGDGQGNFAAPTAVPLTNAKITDAFEIADLSCDGAPGVVASVNQGELRYVQRHPDGTFGSPTLTIPSNPEFGTFAVKDVTGDGRADFVFTTKVTGSIGSLAVAVNGM